MTSIEEAAMSLGARNTASEFRYLPLEVIVPSKTNPRKTFDAVYISDLARSIREVGVLEPVLVRPAGDVRFELISGECRWRAAKEAQVTTIPVRVKALSDNEVLEVQVIENLQRRDLSALEEADGYRQLLATKKYDVARIAERIGMSVKYVYDRVKLLTLIAPLQTLLREGALSAGHGILLARLEAADQKRAFGNPKGGDSPLFEDEEALRLPYGRDDVKVSQAERIADEGYGKPISVRELQAWIDKNVRLEARQVDAMLFPETATTLKTAEDEREKVVRITFNEMTPDAATGSARPILGRSWKRADGQMGSKTCGYSVIGQVVIGHSRGEAFRVCTSKKSCSVHWPQQVKAGKKVKTAATKAVARGEDPNQAKKLQYAREQELQNRREEQWEKALPAINQALAAALKKAPIGPAGQLVVKDETEDRWGSGVKAVKLLPPSKNADSIVRFLALAVLLRYYENGDEQLLITHAKTFGVDVTAILAAALPPLATCRECGCTEAVACLGGCSWIERPDPKTAKGLCSSPKCAAKAKGAKPAKTKAAKRSGAQARA